MFNVSALLLNDAFLKCEVTPEVITHVHNNHSDNNYTNHTLKKKHLQNKTEMRSWFHIASVHTASNSGVSWIVDNFVENSKASFFFSAGVFRPHKAVDEQRRAKSPPNWRDPAARSSPSRPSTSSAPVCLPSWQLRDARFAPAVQRHQTQCMRYITRTEILLRTHFTL